MLGHHDVLIMRAHTMKTLLTALLCALVATAPVADARGARGGGGAVNPLNLPLLTTTQVQGLFTFLGSFKGPGPGSTPSDFNYAGNAMSVTGTTMYIGATVSNSSGGSYAGIGAFTIPTLSGAPSYTGGNGGPATTLINPTMENNGTSSTLNCGQASSGTHCSLMGSIVYNGNLYISVAPFFDTTNGANGFLFDANTALTTWGTVNAATPSTGCTTAGSNPSCTQRYFAGTLGVVPSIWQKYLGGPCYEAAGPGLAIASNNVAGLNFSTFNCASYNPSGGAVNIKEGLDYYYQGLFRDPGSPEQLSYRQFTGPFPLAGGPTPTLAAPVQIAATTATTGGTLAAGTYYYVVTAMFGEGETTASNEESITTTGSTSANTVSWDAVPDATQYRIYRGTASGAEDALLSTMLSGTTTFKDTGGAGAAQSPPTTNTTGGAYTLTAVPTNGTTSVTLSTPFVSSTAAPVGPFQITFSDGETRLVHLTGGNASVPDKLFTCYYGVTGCQSFPALANCPSGGCSTAVTINPMGDAYLSEYTGWLGYAFIVPGTRTLLYIQQIQYGPSAARGDSCNPNASGSNDYSIPPDTSPYDELEIFAYDLRDVYAGMQGQQPVYQAVPYEHWEFPNWQTIANSNCGLLAGSGSFFFDPATNKLYGSFTSNDYGSGNLVVDEWSVNPP